MKKIIALLLAIVMCLVITACGNRSVTDFMSSQNNDRTSNSSAPNNNITDTNDSSASDDNNSDSAGKPTGDEPSSGAADTSKTSTMNVQEFDALIATQALRIVSTKYVVQDEEYKSLYPDMLQAVIQNDTEFDIRSAVVAFVAWDENNLPLKLKGSIDFSDGSYVKKVNYSDINLVPGKTFGNSSGFSIDADIGVKFFKAIVVSFEAFTGESWENPYFDEWCKLYEGLKYTDQLSVDVEIVEDEIKKNENTAPDTTSTDTDESTILAEIEAQGLKIIDTSYIVQDEEYKSLYPDMLQAVMQNDTEFDIRSAIVAFAAWDENNLPVKIRGKVDFSDGAYIKKVHYSDINLIPGNTYGDHSGLEVDENCGITTIKAIVVSYETFTNETWENPLFEKWCELYKNVKLPS